MVQARMVCDEVLHWAETYTGPAFHALLSDCPYELGMMGKTWDRQGISFRPDTWKALAQHLLPGAFGMAFCSSRGWHRLACAIEDAGLIIHPSIFMLGWITGQGFPKATKIPAPAFEGHRYGGQMLKPSLEPILVFQKPYAGKPVDSIVTTGAGALWIEGTRVPGQPEATRFDPTVHHHEGWRFNATGGDIAAQQRTGRWPSNLCLLHLPTCHPVGPQPVRGSHPPGPNAGQHPGYHGHFQGEHVPQNYTAPDGTEAVLTWDCSPGCPVAALNAQAGEHPGPWGKGKSYSVTRSGLHNSTIKPIDNGLYQDTGPVSRFFPAFDWAEAVEAQLLAAAPAYYCSKASPAERSTGLTERNTHIAVKPQALLRWLATLLLPPAAYAPRRLLVPFAGSGSEVLAASIVGWEQVLGIEQEQAHITVAEARLREGLGLFGRQEEAL